MSETLATRTVVVTDPAGVHARTAVAIAEVVRASKSSVILVMGDLRVVATDVLQIMTMVADQGKTIVLEAAGPNADAVLDLLEPLFAGKFGNGEQKSV